MGSVTIRAEIAALKQEIKNDIKEVVKDAGEIAAKVGKDFDDRLTKLENQVQGIKHAAGKEVHTR